jgi:predicted Fe-Mo cluster-binding NifX family protein
MKACLPKSSKMVGRHFGKSPEFACFVIDGGKVTSTEVHSNPGRDKVNVPEMVAGFGATHVIAFGIGDKAKSILSGKGVAIISGAAGSIDAVLERFLKGELKSEDAPCAGEHVCQK